MLMEGSTDGTTAGVRTIKTTADGSVVTSGGAGNGLTNTELRATPVPITGLGVGSPTDVATADPSIAGGLVAVLKGLWTDFRARTNTLGAKSAATSMPVTLSTENTALFPSVNQKTTALSSPVTLPSDQTFWPVSPALTRPADVIAYAAGDLIGSSTTAGSLVFPTITIARGALGGGIIEGGRLRCSQTSGMDGVAFRCDIWQAPTAPTFTNGDNGAYAPATGSAGFFASMTGVFRQFGDGAVAELSFANLQRLPFRLASGSTVCVTMQTLTAFTPVSGATFTPTLYVFQD